LLPDLIKFAYIPPDQYNTNAPNNEPPDLYAPPQQEDHVLVLEFVEGPDRGTNQKSALILTCFDQDY
jgi:hypothetical protein